MRMSCRRSERHSDHDGQRGHVREHGHVHGHEHGHGHERSAVRLGVAAGINVAFAIVQISVGLAIGSVVVLADAAHQAVDALGLITAFVALRMVSRASTSTWSYGFGRADALGGFVSGLILLASVVWIVVESIERLVEPEAVDGGGVVLIGLVAIAVNGVGVLLVGHGHGDEALTLRAARLHLLTDLAGSVVVVVAGLVIVNTSSTWVDPVASLVVSAAVVWSTARLLRSAAAVLLDRSPDGLDAGQLAVLLNAHPSVERVHHVHLRTLGAGRRSGSAHVVVAGQMSVHDSQVLTAELTERASSGLEIDHLTVQVECHPCGEPMNPHA